MGETMNIVGGYLYDASGNLIGPGFTDISFTEDLESTPNYISSLGFPMSANAEFETTADINIPLFEKLCGIDLAHGHDMTASLSFREPYQVQVKRHKKRRINKKWAKRYGYITKYRDVHIENVHIEDEAENSFNIIGEKINYIIH